MSSTPEGRVGSVVDLLRSAAFPERGQNLPPAAETLSDTGCSSVRLDCSAGLVVRSTKLRSRCGSSQHRVPVEPLCPNVAGGAAVPKHDLVCLIAQRHRLATRLVWVDI